MDFYKIKTRSYKSGCFEIYPDFIVGNVKDLMVRGHSFYAIYNEETGFWVTDPMEVVRRVDQDLAQEYEKAVKENPYGRYTVRYMSSSSSRAWEDFCKYLTKMPDKFIQLDCKPSYLGAKPTRKDYISHQLQYELSDSEPKCWNELIGYLYEPEEKTKLEWVIGAIACGDSTKIQKFVVLFGAPGTGKSTVLDIVEKLFDGYWAPFDSQGLTSLKDIALEAFKDNPLVGIEHEGDLSHITTNS